MTKSAPLESSWWHPVDLDRCQLLGGLTIATRVCNILFDDRIGGPQRRVVSVASLLKRSGFETILIVPQGSGDAPTLAAENGIDSRRVSLTRPTGLRSGLGVLRYGASIAGDANRFRRLFKELDADIVHVNGAFFVAPAIGARMARTPVVWHLNDTIFSKGLSRVLGHFVRLMSTTIVAAAQRVAEHYGVDDIATVIHAPVDVARFGERDYVPPSEEFTIGMIANWNRIKGQDSFIETLAHLRDSGMNARGTLVGAQLDSQREFTADVMSRIKSHGLEPFVDIRGFEANPSARLTTFDCFLLCSTSEASPTSVHEAMATGVPVAAFNVGGVAEMLGTSTPEPAGVIVEPGDITDLANAVARILTESDLHMRLARHGPERARALYSLDRCAERHEVAYRTAVTIHQCGTMTQPSG